MKASPHSFHNSFVVKRPFAQLVLSLTMVFVLMTISCSQEEVPESAIVIDRMIFITMLDSQGNNLLDPKHERYYDPSQIRIFYDRNGKLEEFFQGHLDMRRNFRIILPELGRDYTMALALDSEKTVIQWNGLESDTIQAEVYTDFPHTRVTKVYFNGELKWDVADLIDREITIIK
jgi:hypothetical protein